MTTTTNIWQIGESTAPLPPQAAGWPLFGNALALGQEPFGYLVRLYKELGPVFRIRIFKKPVTVLAGAEANRFAQRQGKHVFSNVDVFIDLARELGSPKNMVALEGDELKFFRRTAQAGYSRSALAAGIPKIVDVITDFVDDLQFGSVFEVFPTLQRLTSLQLGRVATHLEADDYIDDLQLFMRYLLNVHLTGIWPTVVLRLPSYRRVKARAHEIANQVVAFHRTHPPDETRPRDLIDDFLQAHAAHPEKMPLAAVKAAALGPFLAGQDTVAATISFMLYAILANPELHERVQEEVDTLFANGIPTLAEFRQAKVLHRTAVETLRRYPVAPFMVQHVSQPFEFAGYRINAGEQTYMAQTVTHFLPEYFDDPFTFNIDRPKAKKHTFAPFGVGPHTCIGAGMGELQIMVNVATLLRQAEFSLHPTHYQLKIKPLPPAPRRFRIKMIKKRAL